MTRAPPQYPLIAIVGSTGTGKSELAVEIAHRYNGEIINGDAMQLYAGLPIITNKITHEEQKAVPHHLLGCIGLEEQTWVVGTFVHHALRIIREIRSRGRLPILVGGTHYYTQSLLFHDRLARQEDGTEEAFLPESPSDAWPILQEPTDVILAELKRVDPIMADRWHPHDRRKIQRSLMIYLQTGRRASDIYAEQRQHSEDGNDMVGAEVQELRFPTLLFWVHCETETLRDRLSRRVDKMLERGLLDEVQTLHAFAAAQSSAGQPVDETRGIWVSIGYKEFKPYTAALLSREPPPAPGLAKLQLDALERTKIATRQYAKSQVRWLRIKLAHALVTARAHDRLFLLDASSPAPDDFARTVVDPACDLTSRFLQGEPLPVPATLSPAAAEVLVPKRGYDLAAAPERWEKRVCEACGITCVVAEQWGKHVRSKAHRKLVGKRKTGGEGRGAEGGREGEG